MALKRSVSVRELRSRCELLEQSVLGQGLATPEELAAHRPGGDANADRGAFGWLRWYGVLNRRHARLEEADRARPAGESNEPHLLDVLRDAPVPVRLAPMDGFERPERVAVHPKSFDALVHLQYRDQVIDRLTAAIEGLTGIATPADDELLTRARAELVRQYHLIAWIIVHEGAAAPFAVTDPLPDPPDWIRSLDALEIQRLYNAHVRANMLSLAVLDRYLARSTRKEARPSWGRFFAFLADDKNVPTAELMRDRSLASLLAASSVVADAKREAEETARQKHAGDAVGAK